MSRESAAPREFFHKPFVVLGVTSNPYNVVVVGVTSIPNVVVVGVTSIPYAFASRLPEP